jgi:hypothetical protein
MYFFKIFIPTYSYNILIYISIKKIREIQNSENSIKGDSIIKGKATKLRLAITIYLKPKIPINVTA